MSRFSELLPMYVSAPSASDPIVSWRDPEHTGANRCWPCTVVNLALAESLVAVTVLGLSWLAPDLGLPVVLSAGGAVLLLSVVAIYLRGYLVPGTPALTRRYVPDRARDWLVGRSGGTDSPRRTLVSIGVLREGPGGDTIELEPEFAAAWRERNEAFWGDERALRASLADLAGVLPGRLEFDSYPSVFSVHDGTDRVASWESRAACVADAAVATLLADADTEWHRRSLTARAEMLRALRLFLQHCPACDGSVSFRTQVVESCCSGRDVVPATCGSCRTRLFEVEAP